ncbi:MAG: alcohol dehydrogenase catalytic domain-containing protein [Actinomycetota bacterium]
MMRAVVFEGPGSVAVRDVPEPELLGADDAIVRVTLSAICGSDLHFLHGKTPMDPGDILGHEAVGVVDAVGAGVMRVRPGDRVVISFDIACGDCWYCGTGMSALCDRSQMFGGGPFTGSVPGAQAERVRVPRADVNLLRVPDSLEDERALFLGDVLTTGFYAASLGGIRVGDTVAVVGAGPLGFFCAQAAASLEPARVCVVDPDPGRLALVASTGATPVDPATRHPQMAAAEVTDGRGADVVIEAVGSADAFTSAVSIVRPGGTVVVAGVYAGETAEIQLGLYWTRALDLRFTGLCPIHAWWGQAMQAVVDERLHPLPLISHRLPLEDAAAGYALFDRREATKVVLRP